MKTPITLYSFSNTSLPFGVFIGPPKKSLQHLRISWRVPQPHGSQLPRRQSVKPDRHAWLLPPNEVNVSVVSEKAEVADKIEVRCALLHLCKVDYLRQVSF